MKTITIDGIEYTLTQTEKQIGKRWRAEVEEKYYSTGADEEILIYHEKNSKYDNYAYISGNYYKTKAEAERARDKQLALVRVTDKLREIEAYEGWVIDWSDYNQKKFYIACDKRFCEFNMFSLSYIQDTHVDMYSCSNAIDYVIKHMQDDLKLIFVV